MKVNYLKIYSHEIFRTTFENKIKISRNEKLEDRTLKTKEEIPRKAELDIFEVEEKPEYSIHIKIPKKEKSEYNIEGYIDIEIEGISANEIRELANGFNTLYKQSSKQKNEKEIA